MKWATSSGARDVTIFLLTPFISGDHFYLTSSNLAATDGTSNFGDVIFTVKNAPKSGIFALVDNMARPIKSFTQESRAILKEFRLKFSLKRNFA